ncbi:hypothetical protein GKQ38_01920 [Candidatus Nanohaloarchaea archaeon]|nr:hypothetical protein GKQ38_01920 [Candidatus Nanohaloarchaea archaeon]
MKDHYENLDDISLFEEKDSVPNYGSGRDYFEERVQRVDDLFEEVYEEPQVYPTDETLDSLLMNTEIAQGDQVVLAVAGDFERYAAGMYREDFRAYHGDVLVPDIDHTLLKINQPEVEAEPSDIQTDNIRFEIPFSRPTMRSDTSTVSAPSLEEPSPSPDTLPDDLNIDIPDRTDF